jgi:hypothetical protein
MGAILDPDHETGLRGGRPSRFVFDGPVPDRARSARRGVRRATGTRPARGRDRIRGVATGGTGTDERQDRPAAAEVLAEIGERGVKRPEPSHQA